MENMNLLRKNKLKILIEGSCSKNVINTYMKGNNIPFLWRKFILKIANNKNDIFKYYNDSYGFHRHCRE